jgi:hypothetical protein
MKRLAAVVLGLGLVLILGCGTQSYEKRLDLTLDNMKYQKRLDDNLGDAATKGKLEELQIYVRPPKNMTGPTQTFQLTVLEPGKYDVESSFIEREKQSLHILGRVKRPKTPSKKAPTQAETPRGEFKADVVDLIKNVYGVELAVSDFKDDTKRIMGDRPTDNTIMYKLLDLNAKKVQIYLYSGKNSPYEVALIFEYPKAEHNAANPKIGLCMESFAVGDKAKRAFAGGETEDIEGTGEAAPPPVAF